MKLRLRHTGIKVKPINESKEKPRKDKQRNEIKGRKTKRTQKKELIPKYPF